MGPALIVYAVLSTLLQVLFWTVLINALLSWVPALTQSGDMAAVARATASVVDPLLDPIRQRLPGAGGLDFSPLVLMLLLQVAGAILARVAAP